MKPWGREWGNRLRKFPKQLFFKYTLPKPANCRSKPTAKPVSPSLPHGVTLGPAGGAPTKLVRQKALQKASSAYDSEKVTPVRTKRNLSPDKRRSRQDVEKISLADGKHRLQTGKCQKKPHAGRALIKKFHTKNPPISRKPMENRPKIRYNNMGIYHQKKKKGRT